MHNTSKASPSSPVVMPPILLLPLLVLSVLLLTNAIVLYPIELIRTFSIPSWLSLVAIALVFSWCFGE